MSCRARSRPPRRWARCRRPRSRSGGRSSRRRTSRPNDAHVAGGGRDCEHAADAGTRRERGALAGLPQTRILVSGMLAKKPRPAYREEAIMKRSMLRAALLGGVLLAAFALPATAFEGALPLAKAPAEQVGMSAKKLERIREALKGEIDQDKLPGTVVMVARKGQLVYADA